VGQYLFPSETAHPPIPRIQAVMRVCMLSQNRENVCLLVWDGLLVSKHPFGSIQLIHRNASLLSPSTQVATPWLFACCI